MTTRPTSEERRPGLVRGVFLRFGAVGIGATLLDILLFNTLHFGFGIDPLTSKAIASVVAVLVAYVGSRWWAFRKTAQEQVGAEFSRFVIVNIVALGITEVCLIVTYYGIGLKGVVASNISANLVGQLLATGFRFWAYSVWVFNEPKRRLSAVFLRSRTALLPQQVLD